MRPVLNLRMQIRVGRLESFLNRRAGFFLRTSAEFIPTLDCSPINTPRMCRRS